MFGCPSTSPNGSLDGSVDDVMDENNRRMRALSRRRMALARYLSDSLPRRPPNAPPTYEDATKNDNRGFVAEDERELHFGEAPQSHGGEGEGDLDYEPCGDESPPSYRSFDARGDVVTVEAGASGGAVGVADIKVVNGEEIHVSVNDDDGKSLDGRLSHPLEEEAQRHSLP